MSKSIEINVADREVASKKPFSPDQLDEVLAKLSTAEEGYTGSEKADPEVIESCVKVLNESVEAVPDIFAENKEYIKGYVEEFERKLADAVQPLEEQRSSLNRKIESLKSQKEAIETKQGLEMSKLQGKIDGLVAEKETLDEEYKAICSRVEAIASGNISMREKWALIGRKKSKLRQLREEGTAKYEAAGAKSQELRSIKSEKFRLDDEHQDAVRKVQHEIDDVERELRKCEEDLVKNYQKFFADLGYLIGCMKRDIDRLVEGGNLNFVETINVDTRARVQASLAYANAQDPENAEAFTKLTKYRRSAESDSEAEARMRGETYEGRRETELNDEPTVFYTNQSLDTGNDSVSSRFQRCALVEVFSPKSQRHVSFHLAPKTQRIRGEDGGTFSYLKPKFFYDALQGLLQEEGCGFDELQVKIVSGLTVPPDQIRASLAAIGCDEEKMKLVQLPISDFTALTVAAERKILIEGEEVELFDFRQQRRPGDERDRFIVSTASGPGLHTISKTGEVNRYVV